MRYASAAALRDALEQRLVHQANETGVDIGRLRRRVVFERLLVRLALAGNGLWVVKGGVAVELRLTDRARTTRDLDLALRGIDVDGPQIRDLLTEALLSNPQRDFFEFRIDRFRPTSMDGAPSPVWRASLDTRLDGRTFGRVVTDIVVGEPDSGRVELLPLPGTLAFAGLAPVEILTVDLNQHFADKLHAMVRRRGERRSTRVKDLADLMLFIAAGFEATSDLVHAVSDVFASTGDHLPDDVPDPPADWESRYEELALELDLAEPTVAVAMASLREFWSRARSLAPETDHAPID
jgi:Nucleotidyl transferase AbiEii toxin, Type IV TA system